MPIIFTGETQQISYENGKLYVCLKADAQAAFTDAGKQELADAPLRGKTKLLKGLKDPNNRASLLAIANETGILVAYQCISNEPGFIYQKCSDLTAENPAWAIVNQENAALNYFNENIIDPRDKIDVHLLGQNNPQVQPPQNWNAEKLSITTNNTLVTSQSSLSQQQKSQVEQQFILSAGLMLYEVKKNCQSRQEYEICLKHLIEGGAIPQNLSNSAATELQSFKDDLTPKTIKKLTLNTANNYAGHIATAGEARAYIHDFLVAELKQSQPGYQQPLVNIQDPKWGALCSPGSDIPASKPIQTEVKKILDAIMVVYKPNGTQNFQLKPDVTQIDLMNANKAIRDARNHINSENPTELKACINLFADQIAQNAGGIAKSAFFDKLERAIQQRLQRPPTLINQPKPEQFLPIDVDPRNPSNHAHFLQFQTEHPEAILLIPDNFDDAALADNRRHTRVGRGGLAGPMAPQTVAGSTAQNPIYDLCTVGIPTGGVTTLTEEHQKTKVKEYFARLYGELRRGRAIAAPFNTQTQAWAFGGGVFLESDLTRFVQAEIQKLQDFCAGRKRLEDLDEAYRAAWNNPPAPSLAFPRSELPHQELEAEETNITGIQAKQDLTNPGFREKFRQWLERQPNHRQLVEESEGTGANKTRILRGTLPSGLGVVVRKNEMRLDFGDKTLSDEELRKSMGQLIDMYKSAYSPGEIPALRPLGNDREKDIIRQLLIEKGVKVLTPPENRAADTAVTETAPVPPAPRR